MYKNWKIFNKLKLKLRPLCGTDAKSSTSSGSEQPSAAGEVSKFVGSESEADFSSATTSSET